MADIIRYRKACGREKKGRKLGRGKMTYEQKLASVPPRTAPTGRSTDGREAFERVWWE
jgi:hypothetical protein